MSLTLDNLREGKSALVIAPHQDDEALGMFQAIRVLGDLEWSIAYVTNGGEKDAEFPWSNHPDLPKIYETIDDVITARKAESTQAMAKLGIPEGRLNFLKGHYSGELPFEARSAYQDLKRLLLQTGPDYIFIPAYENGHHDHDATALIVKRLAGDGVVIPSKVFEYALYNNHSGTRNLATFPPNKTGDAIYDPLILKARGPEDVAFGRALAAIYVSQDMGLKDEFPCDKVEIRRASFDGMDARVPEKTFGEQFFGFPREKIERAYRAMQDFLYS